MCDINDFRDTLRFDLQRSLFILYGAASGSSSNNDDRYILHNRRDVGALSILLRSKLSWNSELLFVRVYFILPVSFHRSLILHASRSLYFKANLTLMHPYWLFCTNDLCEPLFTFSTKCLILLCTQSHIDIVFHARLYPANENKEKKINKISSMNEIFWNLNFPGARVYKKKKNVSHETTFASITCI